MSLPLTDLQKNRLKVLEPRLNRAINEQNYKFAKEVVIEIQGLLRPTKHFVRLVQAKNKLCELAIELNDTKSALSLLNSNILVINKNTRLYLETISLLAICHLRMKDVDGAKKYIKEVLVNHTVIKTERTREIFHFEIINRFNEEVALATLTGFDEFYLNPEEIEKEAIKIIRTLSEDEIFSQIGNVSPQSTKDLIYIVHDYSTKQLTFTERLALPSPDQKIKDKEVGLTVFESVKRVLYNSLCNPESEIYKAWFNNGLQVVLDKKYIVTAVVSCLSEIGFGISMIVPSLVALITKFGIEVYCTKQKPLYISEIRNI